MNISKDHSRATHVIGLLCYSLLLAACSYASAWAGRQGFTAVMVLPFLLFVALALYWFFLVFCFRSYFRALIQVVATWVAFAAGWGVHSAASGWPMQSSEVIFIMMCFVIHLAAYGIAAGGLLWISYSLGE